MTPGPDSPDDEAPVEESAGFSGVTNFMVIAVLLIVFGLFALACRRYCRGVPSPIGVTFTLAAS